MIYIILALLLYTCATMFGVIASRNVNPNISTAITNTISAIIPIMSTIPFLTKKTMGDSRFGMIMAICAGLFIALFTLALNKSYSLNKVAIVAPLVFGGSIFLSAFFSFIFLKEKISLIQGIGLGFLAIGLIFIVYAKVKGV